MRERGHSLVHVQWQRRNLYLKFGLAFQSSCVLCPYLQTSNEVYLFLTFIDGEAYVHTDEVTYPGPHRQLIVGPGPKPRLLDYQLRVLSVIPLAGLLIPGSLCLIKKKK